MVASKVSKKEMHASPDAMQAMTDEWKKLDQRLVFDWDSVLEFHKAVPEAQAHKRKTGKDTHFGRVFGLCTLKGSELEPGAVGRKFK